MNSTYPKTLEEAIKTQNTFWNTQPVPDIGSTNMLSGEIKQLDQASELPCELNENFCWDTLDLSNSGVIEELTAFLNKHYINETGETSSKFKPYFTSKYLTWLLNSPGHLTDLMIGVRVKNNNLLVGFIAGTAIAHSLKNKVVFTIETSLLCVHNKLRGKRLSPLLIKELTRRSQLAGFSTGIFTTDRCVPKPIYTTRINYRPLDIKYLVETGFTNLKGNIKMDEIKKTLFLPNQTHNNHFNLLEETDLTTVYELFNSYISRYTLNPQYTINQFKHIFYNNEFVKTYVLKNSEGRIIDFTSYYLQPLQLLNTDVFIRCAHLFYYTSTYETPYRLIKDTLIKANQDDIKLMAAFDVLENDDMMRDLHFEPGNRTMHYYLYNWNLPPLSQAGKIFIN
jgi:glycylpeptide N-tetradecanoyltransferase